MKFFLDQILKKEISLIKLFPFLTWIGELKNKGVFKNDLLAGVSVALVLIPQSIAYAHLAGLPPQMGLYAAFIPTIIAGLFGSSRQTSTGPVAIVSLLTAASLSNIAISGTEGYILYATLMAFMIGIFQLILGVTNMGLMINFLSHPVIRSFTNAAAIIIIISQLPKIFGIDIGENQGYFYETTLGIIRNLGNTNLMTLFIGLLSFLLIIYFKKFRPNLPGMLFVIIITTYVSWLIDYSGIIGVIPKDLPSFSLPTFNFEIILELAVSSIIIGMIGFMESISIAKTLSIKTNRKIDFNQELIGQGLANLGSGFFGGYPVAGSFSRSAVVNQLKVKTGFFAVVSGIIVGLALLFLTPVLKYIPKVTFGVIIITAVINLIDFSQLKKAWKIEKDDFIVGIITFISTILLAPHLEQGILIGVLLSLSLFLYRTMKPRFIELSKYKDGSLRDSDKFNLETSKNIGIYRFDGTLYFANAEYFSDKLIKYIAEKKAIKLVILDFE